MTLTSLPAWRALLAHTATPLPHLRELFAADAQRFANFSVEFDGWLLDYSKQRVNSETMELLGALWQSADMHGWMARMKSGDTINQSEARAVGHTWLRAPLPRPEVSAVLAQMKQFCADIHDGAWRGATGKRITDVVNIGIGGSDLGPRMVTRALVKHAIPNFRVHYVANLDGADLALTLKTLDPATTLFIICSKTFTTQETMLNARSARDWLTTSLGADAVSKHFVAVSTNLGEVAKFGIDTDNAFAFWDWVGGRYSLWSSVGLSVALAIGFDNFSQLLAGAASMDEHFFNAPIGQNLPALLGLLQVWNTSFLGAPTQAILPYSQSLELLTRHLQQLEMESNGKRVDREGAELTSPACPVIWGEPGTNGQHAFYQLIHQGGRLIPCDFIAVKRPDYELPGHHTKLLANCFAQSQALMLGKTLAEVLAEGTDATLAPNKVFPGNQPSNTLLMPAITPRSIGQLVALYEHKVFVAGCLWDINSFDQWGVEYGKQLAARLVPVLEGTATSGDTLDSSTAGLVKASRVESSA
ncbi:MAG TPA: glucose-6-phosphate isomerase [Rhodocyclaceae bacterium]|nr:glucose-6-phosphate isomerase [Rhodocyclaceae bacterium]